MKRIGRILLLAGKAMKWSFIAFCVYLGSLFFHQQRLNARWIEDFVQSRLPENLVFHLGEGSFGFRQGLYLGDIKLYDRSREDATRPMVMVESLAVNFLLRKVIVVGAYYDKLPDGYYVDGDYAYGPRSLMKEPPPPWSFRFPRLPRFKLVAERPDILGLKPASAVGYVKITPTRAAIDNITVTWPDRSRLPSKCDGWIYFDIVEKRLKGECEGTATQAQIRPHLEILDIPVALPYLDGFTGVKGPVSAFFGWDVDLDTGHTIIELGLHPILGFYNKVPMRRADGNLRIEVHYENGDMHLELEVGPLTAFDSSGRLLDGRILVHRINDRSLLEVDAMSELKMDDLLDIIDCLNDGTLSVFECKTAPSVTVKGNLSPRVDRQEENDLSGKIEVRDAKLMGIDIHDVRTDYTYKGDTVTFTNAFARGSRGGEVSALFALHVPGCEADRATADIDVVYRNGSVEEVADWFDFDLGDRKGRLQGDFHCTGPLATNMLERMDAHGRVKVEDGHIAQMKLFAGMTKALADYVPGVAMIVNQNTLSCDYTVKDGIFRTENLLIEGSLFSISAAGAYDIANDNLDFTVRLEFTRKESILGQYLIRPILWPFAKLLLEFKVTGPIDEARWDYLGILDKVGL